MLTLLSLSKHTKFLVFIFCYHSSILDNNFWPSCITFNKWIDNRYLEIIDIHHKIAFCKLLNWLTVLVHFDNFHRTRIYNYNVVGLTVVYWNWFLEIIQTNGGFKINCHLHSKSAFWNIQALKSPVTNLIIICKGCVSNLNHAGLLRLWLKSRFQISRP